MFPDINFTDEDPRIIMSPPVTIEIGSTLRIDSGVGIASEDYRTLVSWVKEFTYKPGFVIELTANPPETVRRDVVGVVSLWTQVIDSRNPSRGKIKVGQAFIIYEYLIDNREHFYRWLLSKFIEFERHEAREWFKVNGVLFDDPHK